MNILRNFSFLTFAYIIEKIITFVLVIILARYLGVEGYGVYALALSFVGLFNNLFDGGLNLLLMRETAKGEVNRQQLLGQVFIGKVFIGIVILFVVIFLAIILRYPQNVFFSILFYGISMLILSFSNTFRGIFIAFERAEFEGILIILSRLLLLGGILICLVFEIGLPEIMVTHLVAYATVLWASWFICQKKFLSPSWNLINFEIIKNLIRSASPFALGAIMGEIFFNIDNVMISKMVGLESVGYYNAAYKLSFSGVLIANTITLAVYPYFSKNWLKNRRDVFIVFWKIFKALIVLSIAFAVTGTMFSSHIVKFVFGEPYNESVVLLQILLWSLPGLFLMHLTNRTLEAIGEQNLAAKAMFLNVLINIILNFILILKFKAIGASITTVVSSIIIVVIQLNYLKKKMFFLKIDLPVAKIFVCVAGLITALILVKSLNWILAIMLGLTIYFLLIIWLDIIKKDDFKILIGRQIV